MSDMSKKKAIATLLREMCSGDADMEPAFDKMVEILFRDITEDPNMISEAMISDILAALCIDCPEDVLRYFDEGIKDKDATTKYKYVANMFHKECDLIAHTGELGRVFACYM